MNEKAVKAHINENKPWAIVFRGEDVSVMLERVFAVTRAKALEMKKTARITHHGDYYVFTVGKKTGIGFIE
jgi:hypothetical protein